MKVAALEQVGLGGLIAADWHGMSKNPFHTVLAPIFPKNSPFAPSKGYSTSFISFQLMYRPELTAKKIYAPCSTNNGTMANRNPQIELDIVTKQDMSGLKVLRRSYGYKP